MVFMASGIARGHVPKTTAMATTELPDIGGHIPNNRLTDMRPCFSVYIFDIGYPCYDRLTPVKTSLQLIEVMCFFEVYR